MSSPGVVPIPESAKKEFGWKRLFIKAAGLGAGFAVMLCLIVSGWIWYSSRPKPPRPWDKTSVAGKYQGVNVNSGTLHFEFWYALENTTSQDLTLTSGSEVDIKGKLTSGILSACGNCINVSYPVFIPAHHSIQIPIELTYAYPTDRKRQEKEIEQYLTKEMSGLDGFVMFDKEHRYEIELPAGWKSKK